MGIPTLSLYDGVANARRHVQDPKPGENTELTRAELTAMEVYLAYQLHAKNELEIVGVTKEVAKIVAKYSK
jgi:hypothetical protein